MVKNMRNFFFLYSKALLCSNTGVKWKELWDCISVSHERMSVERCILRPWCLWATCQFYFLDIVKPILYCNVSSFFFKQIFIVGQTEYRKLKYVNLKFILTFFHWQPHFFMYRLCVPSFLAICLSMSKAFVWSM